MNDIYNTDKVIRKQREKEKSLSREKDRRDKLNRRAYEMMRYEMGENTVKVNSKN